MTQDELAAIELKAYQIWDRDGRPHGTRAGGPRAIGMICAYAFLARRERST
jgi:hypothetical protein